MRTRQVYTNTDHWFSFHKEFAERAAGTVRRVAAHDAGALYRPGFENHTLEPVPESKSSAVGDSESDSDAVGPYRMAPSVKTQGRMSEREYALRTVLEDIEAELPPEELRGYLNSWLRCARLQAAATQVLGIFGGVQDNAEGWTASMLQSRDRYHFRTGSRTHGGPEGYRSAKELETRFEAIADTVGALLRTLDEADHACRALSTLSESAGPTLTPKKRAEQALDHAVETYLAAFPDSPINMDQRPRAKWTLLSVVVAGLVGGAVGVVLHPEIWQRF